MDDETILVQVPIKTYERLANYRLERDAALDERDAALEKLKKIQESVFIHCERCHGPQVAYHVVEDGKDFYLCNCYIETESLQDGVIARLPAGVTQWRE